MKSKQQQSSLVTWLFSLPFRILFSRFTLAILALTIQVAIIYFGAVFFSKYMLWLFGGATILGLILVIYIINQSDNPSFQISWIILILVFPALGVFIYLFVKLQIGVYSISKRYEKINQEMAFYQPQDETTLHVLENKDPLVANYVKYMNHVSKYAIYQNTTSTYFPLGEEAFLKLLEDLRNAKEYIFLEFFIVAKGVMWNAVLEILKQKVKEGVIVRMLYDGTCSFTLLPHDYPLYLEDYGILCKVFNPVVPVISTQYNNRDHRKIVVIDGKIAYTGGVNLADEYINHIERFGHWKDNMIRLEGEAVRGFVLMFLENWQINEKEETEYQSFLPVTSQITSSSFVLPFGDNPFDKFQVGEVTYFHILQTAKKYVHIMTPYLILDHEMLNTIRNVALSGVEVILLLPHIADKKAVYYMAHTYYKDLLKAGVKIYEYTPGFVHAKMFVSDDEKAVIGSVNLDFRSLYLNFEDAVYMYQDPTILKMEEDFQNTLSMSQEITWEVEKEFSLRKKFIGRVLRVFAPLI